ncbi:PH domain leucine-rich repeat-containing protein phosphatase 2-like isoform X1 [Scyliorhinus canicula]|uniref:PH domain leucine-rich repeat-containing protein phosphatase 2-like isoform X1 n=2 Tax=Scyliorhinus canicula TaxID=7830 RepID=UPI0018F39B42|nr:PH domain leucine-rich repeat-containing protein phosphatase 2-like isoform X1 [Scyliorhinus canicula]
MAEVTSPAMEAGKRAPCAAGLSSEGSAPGPDAAVTVEPVSPQPKAGPGCGSSSAVAGRGVRVLKRNMKRNASRSCLGKKNSLGVREKEWLKGDIRRGCICIHGKEMVTSNASSSTSSPGALLSSLSSSSSSSGPDLQLVLCSTETTTTELCTQDKDDLYLQLHGDLIRRMNPDERPLQILYDYLTGLGFQDPVRIQEEGAMADLSCMIRYFHGKPSSIEQLDRILLSGVFSVRKGKTQLHKWSERQVILCGTCLIVSSVKECQMGKMHVLPLTGGKVEEVKRRQCCLMFSSAGQQGQTYYITFDSYPEYLRWLRQASKVVSQRIGTVDLSCYSLEELPEYLFFSQDITHLNLRHNFMQADVGLCNLNRFTQLKSLNLSNNKLTTFPASLCEISTLTEVNLSCNRIQNIPEEIGNLQNLQTFILDGNCLQALPSELGNVQQLTHLGLSFNDFKVIPTVCEVLTAVDKLSMAGNRLQTLALEAVGRMTHIKHLDLRLNSIRSVVMDSLEAINHVTFLDLRDNLLTELDLSVIASIEHLHCEHNNLTILTLSGFALRTLYVGSNQLTTLSIYPLPGQLVHLDLSRNRLESIPDWVCDAKKLELLDVSHNLITELPMRLLCSLSLQKLFVGHNHLQSLPSHLEHTPLEIFDIQHNQLNELPEFLFLKALNLRCLNVSANNLESLPPNSDTEDSLSVLQELYLTGNNLTDKCVPVLTGHPRLRVLHMAYNQLQSFPASKLSKLELLEELNLSGNKLKTVPTTITNCKRLHTLIVHSNSISVFPEILHLPEIKLVDLSCNELVEILMPETLPATLQELDLAGNTNLVLDHKILEIFSHITTLKIDQKPTVPTSDPAGAPTFWSHGYSEMAGHRNKLCLSVLALDSFGDNLEALYGVFDGDRNMEIPRLLQCTVGDVLAEELQQSNVDNVYMTHTFLVSHRKLGMVGQKFGSSAVLCHIRRDPSDHSSYFTLTVANVGNSQVVLCRDGQPLTLSKVFSLEQCVEELERVKQQKAIITEDNKVNGVTCCTRLLGCTYLFPWVLPRPHVHTISLTAQDEFLILGNKTLWENLSYAEAIEAVRNIPDPLAAAKKLCTLTQSYGCHDNVGAVVVYLNIGEDNCTCEVNGVPLPSPGVFAPVSMIVKDGAHYSATPSSSSGIASEFNSEMSASEVSSEVGSTASDEQPATSLEAGTVPRSERRCSLHPSSSTSVFQRQLSSATFSSNHSDNGLDSDDDQPVEGVISNGSKLEVEVDIHCFQFKVPGSSAVSQVRDEGLFVSMSEDDSTGTYLKVQRQNGMNSGSLSTINKEGTDLKKSSSATNLQGKKFSNGSVVPLEKSHNIIEVATEAPKKKCGYFAAPAQPDPEDQLIVPPDLEEEVKEQMKQHQDPVSEAQSERDSRLTHQEVYDTAL